MVLIGCNNKNSLGTPKTPPDSVLKINYSNTKKFSKVLNNFKGEKVTKTILDSIIQKSKNKEALGHADSIFYFDSLLLKIAEKKKDSTYIARGQSYLAYDFREANQLDSAYHYYNLAQKSYKWLGDSLQVGRKLLEMGKLLFNKGAYYESKETTTESLMFLDSIKNPSYWAVGCNVLANNFLRLNDYSLAKEYYLKAIRSDPKISNQILYSNNLANLYAETTAPKEAISILKTLLNDLPVDFSETEKSRLEHNLALNEWKLNKKDPLQAILKSLKIRKANGEAWGLLSSYSALLDYYLPKNLSMAEKYSDSLIAISNALKNPNAEIETLGKFLKQKPTRYASLAPRYVYLKDSIENSRLAFKNQYAYLKYQDQQEKAQLLALETETAQKEAQLAQQETQKILFLSLSAILLMGGISLYFLMQQRHKKEKLQEIYNTEKRIAEDIHDGLSNDVFGLMTKVQNSETKSVDILNALENIYETSRQISHNNSAVKTGETFEEELKNLISTYQHNDTAIVTKGFGKIDWSLLSEHKSIALYRTINELLVNMRKHSNASLVSFQFQQQANFLKVSYSDNGIGINDNQTHGIGLKNTVSRMQSIKSVFTLVSKKEGRGVQAEISIPI